MAPPTVSLVTTVLNEYRSLPSWMDGLKSQTLYPDECVVVDGGSTDGTLDYLRAVQVPFPIKLICAPGCTISEGRNIALRATSGDIIAVTDAGTHADEHWLSHLVAPLRRSDSVDMVAGFFVPEVRSSWSIALAAATLPDSAEISHSTFLPSSRSVAFRRRWFERGFEYPEWLDYCEDIVLDLQLRRGGAVQATEERALVSFAPRDGLASFAHQYFRYARGDGKAGLFALRHLIRYGSYAIAAIVVCRRRPFELVLMLMAGAFHVHKPFARLVRRGQIDTREPFKVLLIAVLIVVQMVVGDIAKMAGYPTGLGWRVRRDRDVKLWKSGWASRTRSGDLPPI